MTSNLDVTFAHHLSTVVEAKDAVSYFETTWKDFDGVEVEEQALLPSTAEGRWLFQAGVMDV